jgi:hypothetical protein
VTREANANSAEESVSTLSNSQPETKKTRVVIAGGGFVGLSAAQYFEQTLARRPDVEVTLISCENFILFALGFRDSSQEKSPSEMFRFG